MGQAPRRIDKHFRGFKAMEWQAWLTRDAIPLLEHLPRMRPFLENFALLRDIYLTARSWRITRVQLNQLRENCLQFVRQYQDLYFRADPAYIHVMGINVHSLLHLGVFSYMI